MLLHALFFLAGGIVADAVAQLIDGLGIELAVVDGRLCIDDAVDWTADIAA